MLTKVFPAKFVRKTEKKGSNCLYNVYMLKQMKIGIILIPYILLVGILCIILFKGLTTPSNFSLIKPIGKNIISKELHVEGNHFVKNGHIVVLRGASRWSLEYSCGDGHFNTIDFQAMKSWGINIVRLPLNENYFLHPELCKDNYKITALNAINTAESEGLYVLLDLHWIHPQEVNNIDERGGQFPMPDNQALDFWKILANQYKNDPNVLFEFMNEPHDVSCYTWKYGGTVISRGNTKWIQQTSGTYVTPGFQKFIDTVRVLGAYNIIIQGASAEADLSCALSEPLLDSANNLAYQSHFYKTNPVGNWQKKFKRLTDSVPVVAGEYNVQQASTVPPFFENQLQTGYLFWVWDVGEVLSNYTGMPDNLRWQKVRDFMINVSELN